MVEILAVVLVGLDGCAAREGGLGEGRTGVRKTGDYDVGADAACGG